MSDLVKRAAVAMWHHEATRAAPKSVADRRTKDAFEDESPETQQRWTGLAEAALSATHIEALEAERDRLREALTEIATGRNAAGLKVDFHQDIAHAALGEDG